MGDASCWEQVYGGCQWVHFILNFVVSVVRSRSYRRPAPCAADIRMCASMYVHADRGMRACTRARGAAAGRIPRPVPTCRAGTRGNRQETQPTRVVVISSEPGCGVQTVREHLHLTRHRGGALDTVIDRSGGESGTCMSMPFDENRWCSSAGSHSRL